MRIGVDQGKVASGPARPTAKAVSILGSPDRTGWNAASVLILYFLILLVIPSNRTFAALGGAGGPAALFALLLLPWWGWYYLQRRAYSSFEAVQPVRAALFVLFGCILASFAAGASRALTDAEANALNLGLLRTAAFASVFLLASDGIPNTARLISVLRACCILAGLYAALGLLQFFTGQSFVAGINIPGLSISDFGALQDRGGFSRPSATARNPLEYAFVLAMIFPVAVSLALQDRTVGLFVRWFPVVAIAIATVLSVSRSAIVGIVVATAVLFPFWGPEIRRRAGLAALALLAVVWALVPGMVGTLVGLFGPGDPSLKSRTESYDIVPVFWQMYPLFGRGLGTFLPEYRILDNQYLVSLIDTGTLGLLAFIGLLGAGFTAALLGRKGYSEPLLSHLGPGLAGAVAAGASLIGFFDVLSFPQAAGTLFLITGVCGAYWRLRGQPNE